VLALLLALSLDPFARAREVAKGLPFARDAMLEVRRAAAAISDPALRAAVEAQILSPGAILHKGGDFGAAPGGNCEGGHHGYPGGLAVHTLATLLHARGLAQVYQHVYGVKLRDDHLVAAAIWHDSLKAATLPFREDGSCGPEEEIAGTGAHHVLGLATAFLRHLPKDLIAIIASAHGPSICPWFAAAATMAGVERTACPAMLPIEAYVIHFADSDYPLTGASWADYARRAPKGWERYEALKADGNELLFFSRSP
jgi:hypothetical protein